jgi:hypothetical protein
MGVAEEDDALRSAGQEGSQCVSGTASLPRKWKMCKEEERVNSNTDVMYIHVFHMLCRVVVMFTCTLVRSHPDSRGARCET